MVRRTRTSTQGSGTASSSRGPYKSRLPETTSSSSSTASWELGVGASGTDAGLSGTEVLVVAASAAVVFAVAKPGVGASAAGAGASGATASGVAAPEVPTSAATSAVAAEAPVAWTPAGTP